MENYIELAHRTSAPVDKPKAALLAVTDGFRLATATLLHVLNSAHQVGIEADALKRLVYYGKPSQPLNPSSYHVSEQSIKRLDDDLMVELLHAGIGMLTEACEFLDALHATISGLQPLDQTLLKEEIGDSFWYLAKACKFLGTTFEAEQERNIAKLRARYPEKFTEEKAANRDLAQERRVLEGEKTSS